MSRYRAWRPGQDYLLAGEVSVASTRLHWIVLWREAAIFLAVLMVAVWVRVPPDHGVGTIIGLIILAALAYFAYHLLEWYVTYFEVTDKRLLLRSGLLTRRIDMMPVTKVTDMSYERPFAGRLLGWGTFILESAGQDQALSRIGYLPDSDRLYRETLTVIFGGPDEDRVARFESQQQQYSEQQHEQYPEAFGQQDPPDDAYGEDPGSYEEEPFTPIYGRRRGQDPGPEGE